MPASSAADFVKQLNSNKTKSSAKVNGDGTVQVSATHTNGAFSTHARVVVNVGSQSVTIGDGSGVKVCNIDQYLAQLQ